MQRFRARRAGCKKRGAAKRRHGFFRTLRRTAGAGIATVCLLACTPAPTPHAEALEEAHLVVTAVHAGTGPDAPERTQLAFRRGNHVSAPLDREAIGWVPRWGRGAALVDPSGRLYEVRPDGARRMLARDATGALGSDGTRLAYATETGFLTDLHVHDGQRSTMWASGLAGAGVLKLEGERLWFVGGPPGAIVGLWEARPDAAPRCWSNCTLTTGVPFRGAFVPPPGRAEDIEVLADGVAWTDVRGVRHEVTR